MTDEPIELLESPETPIAPARVPNFGHFVLFVMLAITMMFVAQAVVLAAAGSLRSADKIVAAVQNQRLQLIAMAIAYIGTLAISWPLFMRLWDRPFGAGLAWNGAAARGHAVRLILFGLTLGFVVQATESIMPMPKSIPMDDFFQNTATVWGLTVFGTLIAPVFEEIAFRGFLFPALAIGYDWLLLSRTPESLRSWNATEKITGTAMIFSGLLSSALFALIHAAQLGWTWTAVGMLLVVSLVLTWVRVRTRSVAASSMVHACYNLSVFVMLFVGTDGYRHLDKITP